jgi:hypothetical protein
MREAYEDIDTAISYYSTFRPGDIDMREEVHPYMWSHDVPRFFRYSRKTNGAPYTRQMMYAYHHRGLLRHDYRNSDDCLEDFDRCLELCVLNPVALTALALHPVVSRQAAPQQHHTPPPGTSAWRTIRTSVRN